jgi:polyferredoxin
MPDAPPTGLHRWASWLLRHRFVVQLASALVANSYLLRAAKGFCYPVLNCWACPAANFACPLGALQNAMADAGLAAGGPGGWLRPILRSIPLFALGTLVLFASVLGRMMCGWLCPFGWLQELVGRLTPRKWRMPAVVTYLRYLVLAALVFLIPFVTGEPWFCKLCPQGALEGGLPQPLIQPSLRSMIHGWWWLKQALLALTVLAMLAWRRPFCKAICPLGAIFSLFVRHSAWALRYDASRCVHCLWCVRHCPQGIDPRREVGSHNCVGCLECTQCPFGAIRSVPRWQPTTCCANPGQDGAPKSTDAAH